MRTKIHTAFPVQSFPSYFPAHWEIKEAETGNIGHPIYIKWPTPLQHPVMPAKTQNGEKYLYLHRDYLGSIIGISNQPGK